MQSNVATLNIRSENVFVFDWFGFEPNRMCGQCTRKKNYISDENNWILNHVALSLWKRRTASSSDLAPVLLASVILIVAQKRKVLEVMMTVASTYQFDHRQSRAQSKQPSCCRRHRIYCRWRRVSHKSKCSLRHLKVYRLDAVIRYAVYVYAYWVDVCMLRYSHWLWHWRSLNLMVSWCRNFVWVRITFAEKKRTQIYMYIYATSLVFSSYRMDSLRINRTRTSQCWRFFIIPALLVASFCVRVVCNFYVVFCVRQ